jgi:hypothetical protein
MLVEKEQSFIVGVEKVTRFSIVSQDIPCLTHPAREDYRR